MSPSQRDDLLDGLRGQTVIIPDLDSVFPGWPREINKHIASIAPLVNEILDGYARNESMAAKLKKENLALLTSNWWPHADLKTLLDLAHFVGCIFTVDGMIDQASGSGKDKIEAFDALYHDTDDFVQKGLSPSNPTEAIEPRNVLGDCFLTLATLLRKRYTNEQRKTFFDEVKFTIEMLAVQGKYRINDSIPSLEEYRTYREGTCCINAMIALVEYGNDLYIPHEVMQDPDMKMLRQEAVRANWITNDILSVKKELASGFVENLVVLCASDGKAQTGIDTAMELLRSSVDRFETAATKLASRYAAQESLSKDITRFVQGCKYICTGSYAWSLNSKRYGLDDAKRDAAGGIVIVI